MKLKSKRACLGQGVLRMRWRVFGFGVWAGHRAAQLTWGGRQRDAEAAEEQSGAEEGGGNRASGSSEAGGKESRTSRATDSGGQKR
eukprot:3829164-Rhodomonas_salina.1